jgi:hypothetical protein
MLNDYRLLMAMSASEDDVFDLIKNIFSGVVCRH